MNAALECRSRPKRRGPRPRPVRTAAAIILALLLPTCTSIPGMGRSEHGPRSTQETLGWKVVIEKREPNLLLAVDGTECVVSEERFERIRRGRRAFCHWRAERMGS
jgi:hypothetical protein